MNTTQISNQEALSQENASSNSDAQHSSTQTEELMPAADEAVEHNARFTTFWKAVVIVLTIAGVVLTMNQIFFWGLFGLNLITNQFLPLSAGLFLPIVLIVTPIRKVGQRRGQGPRPTELTDAANQLTRDNKRGVPWYDVVLVVALMGSAGYFAYNGPAIAEFGWAFISPPVATVLSFVFWALVLEVLRRAAGWVVMLLALIVSLYPVIAEGIPVGFLQGITYDVSTLAQVHVMGVESIFGLPMQTAGIILVGFMFFGVALQHTGGADFFHQLSNAIFGKYRGGSAKVSVASSAAMGMMSGSAVSNVLTTGPMTIPAMLKSGFSRKTAGAIEATASSGGSITPPIMGTAAFLMVSFAGVPYTEIIVAAAIPAFLYFLGIFLQIDGYAAMRGMTGLPKERLPRMIESIKAGWPYILVLALLTVLLFTLGSEAQAPFYVVGALILIAVLRPSQKFGTREFFDMILDTGKTLGQIIGIIAGVGLILGGLSATGVALSLSRDLVNLVGDNVILILIAGAIACFVLGMGLTISAAYVFLAIVMVPALTALGVDVVAAHLFVIYWASVSYITPPVGLAAFAAAGISKASPMATSVEAMRLGAVKYIVPFGFALNPALVAQAPLNEVLIAGLVSIVAVAALASAFSGWMIGVDSRLAWWMRILLAVGGFMVFLPQWPITVTGLVIVAAVALLSFIAKKAGKTPEIVSLATPYMGQ